MGRFKIRVFLKKLFDSKFQINSKDQSNHNDYKVKERENIPKKYLNSSARKIKNKKKINFFKKYIKNHDAIKINENINSAIIIPDKDIIPGAQTLSPAYIVFDNYEKILKWNRSLRFALAVCTLKENFENEI